MEVLCKLYEMTLYGENYIKEERFSYSTDLICDKDVYKLSYIVEEIEKLYHNNQIENEWITDENRPNRTHSAYSINLASLKAILYSTNFVTHITLTPTTDREFNIYFRYYGYRLDVLNYVRFPNIVAQLPDQFNYNTACLGNIMRYGNFAVLHGHTEWEMVCIKSFIYIFDILELSKDTIRVYAHKEIIPHLVGKGGKNVKKTIQKLHEYGFTNVKRILFN